MPPHSSFIDPDLVILKRLHTAINHRYLTKLDILAKHLNLTPQSLSRYINKLQAYNIQIEGDDSRGYRALDNLVWLSEQEILAKVQTSEAIDIKIFETIPSTNDYLLKHLSKKYPMAICLAETQTQGKGRRGRQWHSPFGKNIYFSMRYTFKTNISKLSGLSLVAALATCTAIKNTIKPKQTLKIKWPNDIIIDQRKLSGILVDVKIENNDRIHAVVGIGINVNMTTSQDTITQPWTSLKKLTHCDVDRNAIVSALMNTLIDFLEKFSILGLDPFINNWKQHDALMGRLITVASGNHQYHGVCEGIDHNGCLVIRTSNNQIHYCSSGDTTVLKK